MIFQIDSQNRTFGSSPRNRNSVIRPLVIMTNILLVVPLPYSKFDEYQEKLTENVPVRGGGEGGQSNNVTYLKNCKWSFPFSFIVLVSSRDHFISIQVRWC